MTTLTVECALDEAISVLGEKGVREPRRWAETLAAAVLAVPHTALARSAARPLTDEEAERLQQLLRRVTPDAPVAYLINQAPFLDGDFEVNRDTLICKPDTELFVEIILEQLAQRPLPTSPHILELCTGSGCVAITLAKRLPGSRVVATDLSPAALAVARRNVARHGVAERVILGEGDLFAPVTALMADRPFDLIVSNPPYIPTEKIDALGLHVAGHEPRLALDGGADGLDPHRRVLAAAPRFLAPGGRLFLEHEYYHGPAARALAEESSEYEDVCVFQDANRRDRALHAQRRWDDDSGD